MTVATADDVFLEHRPALVGLAYRMLGDLDEAEDVVSETYLRWQAAAESADDARAYLFTITSRLCLDALRSARRRRVHYVGTWLPEPLVTDWDDPGEAVATRDTVSLGLMRVLEQLTPTERAVFVLREAFGYPHAEIAELLGATAAAVRQHLHRAQRRLDEERAPRFVADRATQRALTERFVAAAMTGEVAPLADLLAADAVMYADGGGKAESIRRPAYGALRIARFLRGLVRKAPPGLRVDLVHANDAPALLVRVDAEVIGIYALEIDPEEAVVRAVYAVRNPDKLRRLAAT